MTRWWPAAAVGLAFAVATLAVVTILTPSGSTPDQRADALAGELRCPDCQGLSVADSPTQSAREIRRQIDALLGEGASDDAVRQHFVDRYGEWILLAPTAPAAWILPFAAVLAGTIALAAWLRARRSSAPAPSPNLTEEERRRIRADAEALDA